MAGRRARAYEDLRDPETSSGSGIRPGIMQMLFAGGQTAGQDLRTGRGSLKPSDRKMLFAGGTTAREDLRTGTSANDDIPPDDDQMLSGGGDVMDEDVDDGLIIAAEDIMDCLGGYFGSASSDSDSKIEKASKDAARKARAKILAQALKAFVEQMG